MKISALFIVAAAGAALAASSAHAFTSFVIRHSGANVAPTIQPNNAFVPGATEFIIAAASQKAGWGTSSQDGLTLGSISLGITRHDDSTRFTAGSGPAVAPYFNIWITNGVNYAVVANEPSNGSFAAFRTPTVNGGFTYAFSLAQIGAEPAKIFETTGGGGTNTWVHQSLGMVGQNLTFADVANFVISAPSPAYITGGNGVGTGAPREIGTNSAYGINWVFGDTLANYVSGQTGYVVSNPFAIPAPGAAALLAIGGLVATRRRRA